MRKLFYILFLGIVLVNICFSQTIVQGRVVGESGEPLIGANIFLKNSLDGTMSDQNGDFSLEVSENSGVLVISYTGFKPKEIKLGTKEFYTVILTKGLRLDDIVVTGMALNKERSELGYEVMKISGSEVESSFESDISRILRGRAPGLDITPTSGLAGSGTNLIIADILPFMAIINHCLWWMESVSVRNPIPIGISGKGAVLRLPGSLTWIRTILRRSAYLRD